MRAISADDHVGMLLFDEPSASMDPEAEYGVSASQLPSYWWAHVVIALFDALRKMKGNKTLIFSSHRFGNLTRHADLILCVAALKSPSMNLTHDIDI